MVFVRFTLNLITIEAKKKASKHFMIDFVKHSFSQILKCKYVLELRTYCIFKKIVEGKIKGGGEFLKQNDIRKHTHLKKLLKSKSVNFRRIPRGHCVQLHPLHTRDLLKYLSSNLFS